MNETSLLAITRVEDLFPNNEEEARTLYRKLAMRWHPDRDGGNDMVFAHVTALYEKALDKIKNGVWVGSKLLEFRTVEGAQFRMPYLHRAPFELGEVYIGHKTVLYLIEKQYQDLAENGVRMIGACRFANDAMRAEAKRYLPEVFDGNRMLELEKKVAVVVTKETDMLRLCDVVAHFNGKMPPRHAAWVLSCLHNLRCYLEWAGIAHNDISMENYFISPSLHSGALLGGWWYATHYHSKMLALPPRTIEHVPDATRTRIAHAELDAELVKVTGREMLGDIYGSSLLMNKDLPQPMVDWLRIPGQANARDEYEAWYDRVLISSFGARRFVKLELTSSDIYS